MAYIYVNQNKIKNYEIYQSDFLAGDVLVSDFKSVQRFIYDVKGEEPDYMFVPSSNED